MRSGSTGSTATEFAIVALPFLLLVSGGLEYGRMLWTWQALQLAGDETARCVAISSPDCPPPNTTQQTYAVNRAKAFGAGALTTSGVTITNPDTNCNPPPNNTSLSVRLSLTFTSPFSGLIPSLSRTLTTTSCYPLSGH